MANEIRLEGFDKFRNKLNSLPSYLLNKAAAIVQDEGRRWAGLAKRSAPVNFGKLRGEIQAVPVAPLTIEVISPIKYSPYVEWGTGTKVSVPADLVNYALQFKGVRKVIGQVPHAYFFIHKESVKSSLNARLEKVLNTPI